MSNPTPPDGDNSPADVNELLGNLPGPSPAPAHVFQAAGGIPPGAQLPGGTLGANQRFNAPAMMPSAAMGLPTAQGFMTEGEPQLGLTDEAVLCNKCVHGWLIAEPARVKGERADGTKLEQYTGFCLRSSHSLDAYRPTKCTQFVDNRVKQEEVDEDDFFGDDIPKLTPAGLVSFVYSSLMRKLAR